MAVNASQPRPVPARPWLPIAILAVVVVVVAGFFVYNATRPRPAMVEQRDIVGYAALKGSVATPPSAYGEARAVYSAVVDKVDTTLGATVKKGDVLVELANPTANETFQAAKQNVQAAETAYANAKASYDQAIKAAQAQLDAARAAQSGTSTSNTTTNPDGSTVTVTTTPTMDVADAEQALNQAKADRDAGLLSYQQQLDAARDDYRRARSGERMSQVRAPISGTVITLNAQPGKQVGQDNTPVAVVVDLNALKIDAPMSSQQAGVVKQGMLVTLTFDAIKDKQFDGKVERITTQAAPGSANGGIQGAQFIAQIAFNNDGGMVKPQDTATASVKVGEVKNALAVPAEAVSKDETGRPIVYALDNGKWQPVVVQTGMSDGKYIEIKQGLNAGQTVQVTPSLIPASATSK
ncbi:MAG TPA: efflux RND transporter periplasmic adaptor subunit [Chthonomonadaceae bacterium]|nr:efflux RND transporter periplasmic adaptor subunit [Chthonomonadaceae bacterium]